MKKLILLIFCCMALTMGAQQDRVYKSMKEVRNPDSVYHLQLRFKRLKQIPQKVFVMRNLRSLDLGRNFIDSIPPALDNLRQCLDKLPDIMQQLPCLNAILTSLTSSPSPQAPGPRPQTPNPKSKTPSQLTVRIFSFSYKKGIPEDPTGNGGGYVFDCRSTHNPGRYDDYKQLTGLDRPVIEFLERDGEITTFLESVYRLADFHVERYIERGFTSLMFAFGCTGGQHRSVYSAQHLAEHLHRKYGIRILLCHREQGVEQCFAAE